MSPTSVTLNKTTLSLAVGANETLVATVLPANTTNKNVAWSAVDSTIATVDTKGKVVAVKAGTTKITVKTVDGNKSAECALTVTAL
ncbi:Ig domain-containing protein [Enterococcus faecium]|uniref:Ig-like domain-containing protein n=1 Tax=Enterococcus faecium TaxID=1352 RepID=UPI00064CD246|nr:Ig-like domain-containing protein [Enterococcus faecium]EGP4741716.1 Ig domain-containing protein [Enterococcus faecium]EGP5317852.1 Ig domain-containing protein [Enterococcus faecium]EKS9950541.1 Ig domain-containing protein [Enterococcus faecium]EME3509097.1 Ig domain-containing protein [Enterococcus faecium]EME7107745.1 Ig domain-containing protein [Enterococcus faecium]